MNSCCAPEESPKKHLCPACQASGSKVALRTMLHHLQNPWQATLPQQAYYFCTSADCDVVYFGLDNQQFTTNQLRQPISQKNPSPETLICYCFGVTRKQALESPAIRQFVVEQTNTGICSCTTHNPSGKCCLKDFPG